MVRVIPWTTKCSECDVKLEYNNEDVQSKEREYRVGRACQTYTYHYIICPKCGKEVYLD